MTLSGIPAHPLVVHAAVVLTPLTVIAAVVFAVVPRWRYLSRWPTVVLALLSFATLWTAKITGEDLRDSNFKDIPHDNPIWQRLEDHESYADTLTIVSFALLVVVCFSAWLLSGPSGLASGRGARAVTASYVEVALPVALVVVAAIVLVYVVLTGDAGAHAVWNP